MTFGGRALYLSRVSKAWLLVAHAQWTRQATTTNSKTINRYQPVSSTSVVCALSLFIHCEQLWVRLYPTNSESMSSAFEMSFAILHGQSHHMHPKGGGKGTRDFVALFPHQTEPCDVDHASFHTYEINCSFQIFCGNFRKPLWNPGPTKKENATLTKLKCLWS